MRKLFMETNEQHIEKFEIIFDKAKNERMAKSNAVDYYLTLVEDEDINLDTEEIMISMNFWNRTDNMLLNNFLILLKVISIFFLIPMSAMFMMVKLNNYVSK